MSLAIGREEIPLTTNADGVVVVTGTRVSLDLIVETFLDGATAEEIAQRYPTLKLDDIYAVITYYLRHRDEVGAYLERRDEQRAQVRHDIERRDDQTGIRQRLLARRASN